MLADMAINLEVSRLITYKAANDVDKGIRSSYNASIAKCFAADTANQTAANAVQVPSYSLIQWITVVSHARRVSIAGFRG